MQQLPGRRATADDGFLKQLFLQKLPANIRMVLATSSTTSLEKLSELADKVAEVATPHVAAIQTPPASEIDQLREEVAKLTATVKSLARRRSPTPTHHA